ncbi:hypothetical protein EYF80_034634 [Liparis tanakae]|uniref:Uncharacterized protein n=1 Tax=Liparis tanakae TaxID=230148 RepID=A0A4Z2GPB3_9TELE|nr:hypothetical protein EYF80_034634 [Liparis tanakae]
MGTRSVTTVAEGAVDEAGSELSAGDEEGVERYQLTPEVGRRRLSDVHRHRHRGDAYKHRETPREADWAFYTRSQGGLGARRTHLRLRLTGSESEEEILHPTRCHRAVLKRRFLLLGVWW